MSSIPMLTRCFEHQFAGLYTHERALLDAPLMADHVRTLPRNMSLIFYSIWEVWNIQNGQLILMGIKSEEFEQ